MGKTRKKQFSDDFELRGAWFCSFMKPIKSHGLTFDKEFIFVSPFFDVMSEDRFPVVDMATTVSLRRGMNIICFVT